MLRKIAIKSPDGEEVELVASEDPAIIEGAKLGARALLDLFTDEIDLESGYQITESPSYT